jgi:hypothetical protein
MREKGAGEQSDRIKVEGGKRACDTQEESLFFIAARYARAHVFPSHKGSSAALLYKKLRSVIRMFSRLHWLFLFCFPRASYLEPPQPLPLPPPGHRRRIFELIVFGRGRGDRACLMRLC